MVSLVLDHIHLLWMPIDALIHLLILSYKAKKEILQGPLLVKSRTAEDVFLSERTYISCFLWCCDCRLPRIGILQKEEW